VDPVTDFDVAARSGAKFAESDFINMIAGVEFDLRFERWID
jgi:hypothetical protein